MYAQTWIGERDTLAAMERIGQVLVETYRLDRLIAEGGMAYVFEASHLRIPKRFAVKFLKLSLVSNSEALLRFRREAEIIATLEHPNIVNLVDYNISEDGVPYIVMEFLDGEHLGNRLAHGKLPLSDALRISQAVAAALAAAHARDIVHRDLKPENIILCKGDVVKVVDFGVAKLRGAPELTAFNTILGTVAYMAPEQITAKAIDARTDQYALGVILHELLSGQPPAQAASVAEQAMKILYGQLPPVEGVAPQVNEVLFRAMAKNPFERYASVGELMSALLDAAQLKVAPAPEPRAVLDEGLPELPGDATKISAAPPTPDALDHGDDDEDDSPTDAEPVATPASPSAAAVPPPPPAAAVTLPAGQRSTLLMDQVSASSAPTPKSQPVPKLDVSATIPDRATLPPLTESARPTLVPDAELRALPGMRPPPAHTLPPQTAVPYVPPDTTASTPFSDTLRGRGRSLPLWAWFAVGVAASGGLVTAFWLLALRH
jgi:serine/threonine-protein kinase